MLEKFKGRNVVMVTYAFVLSRESTGSKVCFKEKMPKPYFMPYIEILRQSYPEWSIEASSIVEAE